MPEGTIFHHINLGRGWIEKNSIGKKLMQFRNGERVYFNSDNNPLDQPMKLIMKG